MKLLRFGPPGQEKPGIIDAEGRLHDLPLWGTTSLARPFRPRVLPGLPRSIPPGCHGWTPGRIGPCVGGTDKFICIGLNSADHAAESGMAVPPEPVIFMKATSAICGPDDPACLPRGSEKTDWEVELAVIIGSRAKYVSPDQTPDHVAGYAVANDISERSFQTARAGQWTKGKSCDSFGPLGPWPVTRNEVPDPQNLGMWLRVNGRRCSRARPAPRSTAWRRLSATSASSWRCIPAT